MDGKDLENPPPPGPQSSRTTTFGPSLLPLPAGYSNQLHVLTKGALSLDDFRVPDTCSLDPVKPCEVRHSIASEGGVTISYIRDRRTGQDRPVLPPGINVVKTLVLGLDEGSIGAAGVAAAAFQQKANIWARFDKIHRVIRDLKLAEACCDKLFTKTKMWST